MNTTLIKKIILMMELALYIFIGTFLEIKGLITEPTMLLIWIFGVVIIILFVLIEHLK